MVTLFVVALTCLLTFASLADAGSPYRFQTIDPPCPGCVRLQVAGLTSQGTLLGTYTDAAARRHGFLWPRQGNFTTLLLVDPRAINLAGVIVGALPGFVGSARGLSFRGGHAVPGAGPGRA